MSNNDWVQEGTPREPDDWGREQDDYGVPVQAPEWDDYSSDQTVPVPTPRQTAPEEPASVAAPVTVEEPEEEAVALPVGVEEPALEEPAVAEQPSVEEPEEPADRHPAPAGDPVIGEPVVEEDPDRTAVHSAFVAPEAVTPEAGEPSAADEPPVGEPVVEDPVVEDPVVEDPVAEDPVVEEDPDRTAVHAAFVAPEAEAPAVEGATTPVTGLYRESANEQTQVIDTDAALAAEAAEEAQRDEQLRLEKEARDQRLGMVATSEANALRDPHPPRRPGLGGFGSFGALVLRLVLAFVLGVSAWQILGDVDGAANYLGQTVLPYPREIAWGLGSTLAAMAVMLLLGLGVRVAGFLLAAIAGCALAFLRWGPFPIFADGVEGFRGDKELVLVAVGILLVSIGGGKVGIDGAFSKARWNAKLAKRS